MTPLSSLQRDALALFADAVATSPHNLVSRRAREELTDRHLPECVAFSSLLPRNARVLDVGSGGGFPGIVVAICRPDLELTLLDATVKKVAFLREISERLGLTTTVLSGRAEELQRVSPWTSAFDVVTARAVAPLRRLLPWTIPFLRPGGLLYAIKGERWEEELQEAETALRDYGAAVVATPDDVAVDHPDDALPRVVVIQRMDTARGREDPRGTS